MQTGARAKMFTMRMSEEEAERFTEVAEHLGLSLASTFRTLLDREHDKIPTKPRARRPSTKKTSRAAR